MINNQKIMLMVLEVFYDQTPETYQKTANSWSEAIKLCKLSNSDGLPSTDIVMSETHLAQELEDLNNGDYVYNLKFIALSLPRMLNIVENQNLNPNKLLELLIEKLSLKERYFALLMSNGGVQTLKTPETKRDYQNIMYNLEKSRSTLSSGFAKYGLRL